MSRGEERPEENGIFQNTEQFQESNDNRSHITGCEEEVKGNSE